MPKLKTKKTAAKKFKFTGKGKVLRRHVQISHLRSKESVGAHHRKDRKVELTKTQKKKVKKMVPYG